MANIACTLYVVGNDLVGRENLIMPEEEDTVAREVDE